MIGLYRFLLQIQSLLQGNSYSYNAEGYEDAEDYEGYDEEGYDLYEREEA